jgi:hypothetical protein
MPVNHIMFKKTYFTVKSLRYKNEQTHFQQALSHTNPITIFFVKQLITINNILT